MFKKLYIFIFTSFVIFFSTLPVFAASGGLIRPYCPNYDTEGCTLCDGIRMAKGIMDFLAKLSISIAMLSILVGGVMYIFAGADPALIGKAKKIFKSTATGLAYIFGAWLIINIILSGMGVTSFATSQGLLNPSGWFVIKCK